MLSAVIAVPRPSVRLFVRHGFIKNGLIALFSPNDSPNSLSFWRFKDVAEIRRVSHQRNNFLQVPPFFNAKNHSLQRWTKAVIRITSSL